MVNAADGDERMSLLVEVINKHETAETGGRTNPFMKKSASQRDKNLDASGREQGGGLSVTAPRSKRLQILPAFSGLVILHDVFTKCIS